MKHRLALLGMTCCAMLAAVGCEASPQPAPVIDLDVVRRSEIDVGYDIGPAPGQLGVLVSLALPSPPVGAPDDCYRFAEDLGIRINGHGPSRREVRSVGTATAPACSSRQIGVAQFELPDRDGALVIQLSQGQDTAVVTVARPPHPPVELKLPVERTRVGSSFWVELRAMPGALSTDAACWDAWLCPGDAERGDCAHSTLLVASSQATETGVRLELQAPDAAAAGVRSLWLSSRAATGCDPQPTVTCPAVARCDAHTSAGYFLGPYPIALE